MMWEAAGNYWADSRNGISMASYHTMMHGIHVLLVDHDAEALVNTAKNLEMCQYKVTFVELASAAIAMLLSGKAKFDVVMANINSPDLHGLKLLQHAVSMCIPVILMSVEENAFTAMRALEDGAFLYIKKPPSMEFLRCLWQHALRERTRMIREREMFMAANNIRPIRGIEFREVVRRRDENPNPNPNRNPNPSPNPNMMKNKGKHKIKSRGRDGVDCEEENDIMTNYKSNVRRKMCTEWTQELHAKFMTAIEQLGEGRCFPKEILEMMNEPGLTRMQVASHLQKCRNDNWRSPEERKAATMIYHHQTSQHTSSSSNGSGSQPKPRRFGSKPTPTTGSFSGHFQMGQTSGTHSESETPNNININMHAPHYFRTNNLSSSNSKPRHASDDHFFNFLDIDSLQAHDFQQPARINNPGRPQQRYHRTSPGRAYNDMQNCGETSSQTKSPWSSGTSNLESNYSGAKANK